MIQEAREAIDLLNELHRERLTYDEYTTLMDCVLLLEEYAEKFKQINNIMRGVKYE